MKRSHPIYKELANDYGHIERRVRQRTGGDSEDEQTGRDSEDELGLVTDDPG